MKIKFIVGDPPMGVAKDWNEITKRNKKGYSGYSHEDYSKVIGLETIKDFEDEIIKSRINLNIPKEGFDYKKIEEIIVSPNPFEEEDNKIRKNIENEVKRLNEIFIFDKFVKEQLPPLILGNFVLPNKYYNNHDGSINYEVIRDEEFDENGNLAIYGISININRPVKKNKLIRFIKDNWDSISIAVDKLSENKFNLTDYELEIFNLRNQGLPYKTITKKIIENQNIDNEAGKINEDSVKTSFHRTKEKLDLLVKRKVTKK